MEHDAASIGVTIAPYVLSTLKNQATQKLEIPLTRPHL